MVYLFIDEFSFVFRIYFKKMESFKICTDNYPALKYGSIAVFVGGVGLCLHRLHNKEALWKKCVCFQTRYKEPIELKLQQLDEDDDPALRESVLEMSADSVIQAAKNGSISPTAIIRSYIYKACLVSNRLNCLTGLIEDAEAFASELDLDHSGNSPLFGLPVSLKENLETTGMDCTSGLYQYVDDPAMSDCVVAQVLKRCGAIPFVKTNLSQMTFSFESSNPLFGTTVHPLNKHFTTGGSSAGEGALIASGGSILGFGTDTGGSIRCPSHLCGIAGLMPTRNRISVKGLKGLPGQIGPMSKKVDNLVMAMRALLCPLMFQLDITVPPIPFNNQVYLSKTSLRIGFYIDDGYCTPVPAIQRAVGIAKAVLARNGHTLVPFTVPRAQEAMEVFAKKIYGVEGPPCKKVLDKEYIDPILADMVSDWSLSSVTRWIKGWWRNLKSSRIGKDLHLHKPIRSIEEDRRIDGEIRQYQEDFYDAWSKEGLQAVICPPFPVVAGPLGSLKNASTMISYTGLYNLLAYPAGVVPVTKVNQSDMVALKSHKGHFDDEWDRKIKKTCENSLGMPVGVQCVSLPYCDEICLRIMKEIETDVDFESC